MMDTFCEEYDNLLITRLLQDLRVGRARLQESRHPIDLRFHDHALQVEDQQFEYSADNFQLYEIVVKLLLQEFSYYPEVIGDFVYNVLNIRTNQHTSMDVLGVHSVIMRCWTGTLNKVVLQAHHMMGDSFKGVLFDINGQNTACIRYRKQPWEFYSGRAHTTDVALFAYLADMFNRGDLRGETEHIKMIELCNAALPDWHPLIREDLSS